MDYYYYYYGYYYYYYYCYYYCYYYYYYDSYSYSYSYSYKHLGCAGGREPLFTLGSFRRAHVQLLAVITIIGAISGSGSWLGHRCGFSSGF